MRNVAIELVRMSVLLFVVFSLFKSPTSLESVDALLDDSLDRFSGDPDEFGETICIVLLRPPIDCAD